MTFRNSSDDTSSWHHGNKITGPNFLHMYESKDPVGIGRSEVNKLNYPIRVQIAKIDSFGYRIKFIKKRQFGKDIPGLGSKHCLTQLLGFFNR